MRSANSRGSVACLLLAFLLTSQSALRGDEAAAVKRVRELGGDVMRADKAPGGPIVGVDLGATETTDDDLKILAEFKNLKELYVDETRVTDAGLKHVVVLKDLESLDLAATAVTEKGLKELAVLKKLKSLFLDYTKLEDSALKIVAGFGELEDLILDGTDVTDAGLKQLRKLPKLKKLSLADTQMSEKCLQSLSAFPSLEELALNGIDVTDEGLKTVPRFKHLYVLELDFARLSPAGFKELNRFAQLKELNWRNLTGQQVDPRLFQCLFAVTTLEKLTLPLPHIGLTDDDLKGLAQLTNLRELQISTDGKVTEKLLQVLAPLQELRSLELSGVYFGAGGLKALARFKKLESLRIECPDLTGGLGELAALENLENLELSYLGLTSKGVKMMTPVDPVDAAAEKLKSWDPSFDADLRNLSRLKKLKSVTVSLARMSDAGVQELSRCPNLESLHLRWGTYVPAESIQRLAGLKKLHTLNLNLTDETLKACREANLLHFLACADTKEAAARMEPLSFLDMKYPGRTAKLDPLVRPARPEDVDSFTLPSGRRATRVTDAGLMELAPLKNLRNLYLSQAKVSDAGLKHLAGFKKLEQLSLDGAEVTDAGLKELSGLKQLKWLNLSGTKVTAAGVKELAGLPELALELDAEQLSDEMIAALAAAGQLERLSGRPFGQATGFRIYYDKGDVVKTLNLETAPLTDAALKHLACFKNLQNLILRGTKVTDAGLKDLTCFKDLRYLDLTKTSVGDEGMKVLTAFSKLEVLVLEGTAVTGKGLKELKGLKNLQSLRFEMGEKITDELLATVRGLGLLHVLNAPIQRPGFENFYDELPPPGAQANRRPAAKPAAPPARADQVLSLSLERTSVTDAGVRELVELRSLQSLSLCETKVSDASVPILLTFRKLQVLDLRHTMLTEAGLKKLVELPELRTLSFDAGLVTDEVVTAYRKAGLLHLLQPTLHYHSPLTDRRTMVYYDSQGKSPASAEEILDLNLAGTSVTDKGLKELAVCKNLRFLSLRGLPVTDAGLNHLATLRQLQVLDLDDTKVTGLGVQAIAGLRDLKVLRVGTDQLTDDMLLALNVANFWHVLSLADGWTPKGQADKLPGDSLRLYLANTQVTDKGLRQLAELKNLHYLELTNTRITDDGLRHLAGLDNLRFLGLASMPITDDGVKHLTGLKRLETLELSKTKVTDAGLKHLAGLTQLQTLHLGQTALSDDGIKELAPCKRLKELYLDETQVTDAGLKTVAEFKDLAHLNLSQTRVTDAGLAELLPKLKKLESLRLAGTAATNGCLTDLAGLPDLKVLELTGTKVTDGGFKDLAALKNLEMLVLPRAQITDRGLAALAKGGLLHALRLSGSPLVNGRNLPYHIKDLDLAKTPITDAGLKELAGLKTLESLDLTGTRITDASLKVLTEMKTLRWLHLDRTKMTEAAVAKLKAALPDCHIIFTP